MPTEQENRIKDYHDQCFMMEFLHKFAAAAGSPDKYSFAPRHISEVKNIKDTKSISFLNLLTSRNAQNLLSLMPNDMAAELEPEVKIYKVVYNSAGRARNIPLDFGKYKPTSAELDYSRATWAGGMDLTGVEEAMQQKDDVFLMSLEEFTYEYAGVNPAEVDHYIRAKLKLHANSVQAFFLPRGPDKVSFADLIKRPRFQAPAQGSDSSDGHREYDESYFRIKIEIKYPDQLDPGKIKDYAEGLEIMPTGVDAETHVRNIYKALQDQNQTFFLNILKHSIDFDPKDMANQGFDIEIDYIAAVETALHSPNANILVPPAELIKKREENEGGAIFRSYQDLRKAARDYNIGHLLKANDEQIKQILTLKNIMENTLLSMHGEDPRHDVGSVHWDAAKKLAIDLEIDITGQSGYSTEKAFERLAVAYGLADIKEKWKSQQKAAGVDSAALRAASYTRIIEDLWTPTKYGERIHKLSIRGTELIDWINGRSYRANPRSDEELKALRKRIANKDEPEDAKRAQKELEEATKKAQLSARSTNLSVWKDSLLQDESGKLDARASTAVEVAEQGEQSTDASNSNPTTASEDIKKVVERQNEESTNNVPEGEGSSEQIATAATTFAGPSGAEMHEMYFVYFGDLIDAAISIAQDFSDAFKLKIPNHHGGQYAEGEVDFIFGPIVYNNFNLDRQDIVSLARVPISMKLFQEFWIKNVVKRQRESLPLQQFIKLALSQLIGGAFTNKCAIRGESLNRIRGAYDITSVPDSSRQQVIFRYPRGGADICPRAEIISRGSVVDPARLGRMQEAYGFVDEDAVAIVSDGGPIMPGADRFKGTHTWAPEAAAYKLGGQVGIDHQIMFLYATTNRLDHLRGNRTEDVPRGILHLNLGTGDRIPVTNISFSKTDQPMYLESKGDRAGLAGNPLELSEPYNVTIDMKGNGYMKPGRHLYLYLDRWGRPFPKPISEGGEVATADARKIVSPSRALGVGGYFMVTSVSNELKKPSDDANILVWTSNVVALWVSFGEGRPISAAGVTSAAAGAHAAQGPALPGVVEQGEILKEAYKRNQAMEQRAKDALYRVDREYGFGGTTIIE